MPDFKEKLFAKKQTSTFLITYRGVSCLCSSRQHTETFIALCSRSRAEQRVHARRVWLRITLEEVSHFQLFQWPALFFVLCSLLLRCCSPNSLSIYLSVPLSVCLFCLPLSPLFFLPSSLPHSLSFLPPPPLSPAFHSSCPSPLWPFIYQGNLHYFML